MISWALKRNSDTARDAPVSDDTTQIDQPDTPAPIFAVRALKTALFGTPAPRERRPPKAAKEKTAQQDANPAPPPPNKSPAKLPGILLTPGTGTARRKRVSFGHDVKQGPGGPARTSTSRLPDECPGKFPSPWVARSADSGDTRPKTKLQQAMENSRRNNDNKENGTDEKDIACPTQDPEDGWEEVDDESEHEADITTDLNEPHSRSGKYWKSYFETYHSDAKAEMERLVKYKHLAKSYAKMKDAEALELSRKLKEEQEKVKAMEEKIAEMTRQAALTARRKGGEYDPKLAAELDKQTALAMEYKKQVDELESLLQVNIDESGDGRHRQRRVASPRTQRTLMETQRELRRARSQIRELDKLQEERDRLRSDLRFTEQRATKLAEENRKLSGELSQSTSRIQDLEKRLEDSGALYEKLKEDAKARYLEAQQVLERKNERISKLEEEVSTLRKQGAESRRIIRLTRAKSVDGKTTALKSQDPAEEGAGRLLEETNQLGRTSSQKEPASSVRATETKPRERRGTEGTKRGSYEDGASAPSRALRKKHDAESGTNGQPPASVLSDRGNLQDSRSSASSGRSAHAREEQPRAARPERPSRSTWEAKATSAEKGSVDDLPSEARDKRASKASVEQAGREPAARPVSRESVASEIDLVQGYFGRLGGREGKSSGVGATRSTARTGLPAERRAAAIARLQRKKAEREMQQLGLDKENAGLH